MSAPEPERHGGFVCLMGPPTRLLGVEPFPIWVHVTSVDVVMAAERKGQARVWIGGNDFHVIGTPEQVVHWLHDAREAWMEENFEDPEAGD